MNKEQVNSTVFDPREHFHGRMPKTDTFFQPTGNNVLIRCRLLLSKIELRTLGINLSKTEDSLISRYMIEPTVCGYGAGTSNVEIGDKVVLGDNYSVIMVNINKDEDFVHNVIDRVKASDKSVILTNDIKEEDKHYVNLYFLVQEYLIVGRIIETPNA